MSDNLVLDLSMQFAIDIVNLCENLKGKNALVNQLLRSGTSIGANIHEANYASSRADFIAKMQIALRECHETEYWLKLFVKTNIISEDIYQKLSNNGGKIRRILIASINTTKENSKKTDPSLVFFVCDVSAFLLLILRKIGYGKRQSQRHIHRQTTNDKG